jgi:hypothetical protein
MPTRVAGMRSFVLVLARGGVGARVEQKRKERTKKKQEERASLSLLFLRAFGGDNAMR